MLHMVQVLADNSDRPFQHSKDHKSNTISINDSQHPFIRQIDTALEAATASSGFKYVNCSQRCCQQSKQQAVSLMGPTALAAGLLQMSINLQDCKNHHSIMWSLLMTLIQCSRTLKRSYKQPHAWQWILSTTTSTHIWDLHAWCNCQQVWCKSADHDTLHCWCDVCPSIADLLMVKAQSIKLNHDADAGP